MHFNTDISAKIDFVFFSSDYAAQMFTHAVEGSIFHKAYKSKMTEESFSKKHHKPAMHDFMNEQNSAFYTFTEDIPKDILCKVIGYLICFRLISSLFPTFRFK